MIKLSISGINIFIQLKAYSLRYSDMYDYVLINSFLHFFGFLFFFHYINYIQGAIGLLYRTVYAAFVICFRSIVTLDSKTL